MKQIQINMNHTIRKINDHEIPILGEFLYEAIFLPEGVEPPDDVM
jgi:hypothetical protein